MGFYHKKNGVRTFCLVFLVAVELSLDKKPDTMETLTKKHVKEAYERYHKAVYYYILRKTSRKEQAEDVVGKVFLSLSLQVGKLEVVGSIKGYLIGSARNSLIDYYRKKSTSMEILVDMYDTTSHVLETEPHKALIIKERKEFVQSIINDLPPSFQRIVRLRYFKELSLPEIAEELGLTLSTVKNKLYLAKIRLRKWEEHRMWY